MAKEPGNGPEMLDVIDPSTGAIIDQRTREDVHGNGLWHRVFHCLIVRPCAGTIVLQERSLTKKAFPGKLDLSATGHLEAGEEPIHGLRELREELGVELAPDSLVPLGTRLISDDSGEGRRNQEQVHLFFAADDRAIDAYHPCEGEVSALVEVRADDLLALLAGTARTVPCTRFVLEVGTSDSTMERGDLVADTDGYWTVVAVMAQRFLAGDRPLAI